MNLLNLKLFKSYNSDFICRVINNLGDIAVLGSWARVSDVIPVLGCELCLRLSTWPGRAGAGGRGQQHPSRIRAVTRLVAFSASEFLT